MTYQEYCMAELGYETKTTFWSDFSLAEKFGKEAIIDTFQRAFREWRNDYVYLTELVIVLNHKIWHFYDKGDKELSALYDRLWRTADSWASDNLTGKAAQYYFSTTD